MWLLFFVSSFLLASYQSLKWHDYGYHSLHALEYPTATADLAARTFKTPALPMRLASAWEIQDALALPKDSLASGNAMLYPLIERKEAMEGAFNYNNALVDKQMQAYCPLRGETQAQWQTRTQQNAVATATIKDLFTLNQQFEINHEHAVMCRAQRPASMTLAHIADKTFTLFAAQNSFIALMYAVTVSVMFLWAILVARIKSYCMQKYQNDPAQKMFFSSMFAILVFVLSWLSVVPLLMDYFSRTDSVQLPAAAENKGDIPLNTRAVGSYVLGMWTILFTFIYIYIMPALDVTFTSPTDAESLTTNKNAAIQNDENMIQSFVRRHALTTLAYWNLMQTPCLVMAVLASQNAYGIDAYTQLIMYGAVAIGVLDVLHARVNLIARLTRLLNTYEGREGKDSHINLYVEVVIYVAFLAVKLAIAAPIFVKLAQTNTNVGGSAVVGVALMIQTMQVTIEAGMSLCFRGIVKPADGGGPGLWHSDDRQKGGLFDVCLVLQTLMSTALCLGAFANQRLSM